MKKYIIPYMETEKETSDVLIEKVQEYENKGADELMICNYKEEESDREEFLMFAKTIVKSVDLPVNLGVYVKRFEDVKKAFYTGAKAVVISYRQLTDKTVIDEAIKRFGADQIIIDLDDECEQNILDALKQYGVKMIITSHTDDRVKLGSDSVIYVKTNQFTNEFAKQMFVNDSVGAIVCDNLEADVIRKSKADLKSQGCEVNTFESAIDFSKFKLNQDGLIPAIVQDYKSNEVLMMAYMNEEAYRKTIETGCMTYYSRSRKQLWLKGETSGHYQYVKEMRIDCDNDTILAKVKQVGAACHTGNRSCFFTELVKKEYDDTNPFTVFEDVYGVIMDRKMHPKEGSYTNYLFDKGIDKILKKCGEEATEIVIAAKNPEVEELKYEISDFLYHCMVLMAERGVDWEDITKELAHRR